MKYETMVQILFLLLSKGKVSARYIASRFDVSTRTVMRYIDTMCLANIPIIADPGRNGGFYIADTYKLPASFLTEKEFSAVISTLNDYNKNVGSKTVATAVEKLLSIKNPKERVVNVQSGNLIIDGSSWNGNDNVKNVISLVSSAIEDCAVTRIGYVDKDGNDTTRNIEPHAIVLKQGLWYVYAFCRLRNDFRMFKASRIAYADKKDEIFEKRKVEINNLSNGKWFANLPSQAIELSIDRSVKADIEEWLGVDKIFTLNGKLTAQATLPISEWLVSKILGFGGKVKVVAPENLKQMVLAKAKSVIDLYD
ncbi:MAG: YafY family transcriptional regulator [Clostridia bacterium]|nr:YafY family transcriptional regulator [Clostridia bacterium]